MKEALRILREKMGGYEPYETESLPPRNALDLFVLPREPNSKYVWWRCEWHYRVWRELKHLEATFLMQQRLDAEREGK